MVDYARIDAEAEAHRTDKALKELVPFASLPLANGVVQVEVDRAVGHLPASQHIVATLIHLLLRMKGVVREVWVEGLEAVARDQAVPLRGTMLFEGLEGLAHSLNGPASRYPANLRRGRNHDDAVDVRVAVGNGEGDIRLGADAWRALLGTYSEQSRWSDRCPLGAHMAGTIGAAEVFKRLLHINFGWKDGELVTDLAFSLLDYGVDELAGVGRDVDALRLRGVALAGAGAGGTAMLYTLASFPTLQGDLTVVEPGRFKESNLNRYPLSTYTEVHSGASKLESAMAFLARAAPGLRVQGVPSEWQDVPKQAWQLVVSTVDTPEARWQVQRTAPEMILDAGVMMGTLYAVLRVVPGGWCLECKHPPDPEVTWKKRAAMWGMPVEDTKERYRERRVVSAEDIERLADVQGRPMQQFAVLEGIPFDEVPALTECGETPLSLTVPAQAPVMPFATMAAGVAIAAEIVKDMAGIGEPLENFFAHDLRWRPKARMRTFRPSRPGCSSSSHAA